MTMTAFAPRAAICTAVAITATLQTMTMNVAAHAETESWGAIAISPDGLHVGVSKNLPTESAANKTANFNCQQDNPTCDVMISFKYPECGAVVKTEDQYYRDLGTTQREAEQNAIKQSPKITTRVVRSQCNDAPAAG